MKYSTRDHQAPWHLQAVHSLPVQATAWRGSAAALAEWVIATQRIRGGYGRYLSEAEMSRNRSGATITTERFGNLKLDILELHFQAQDRSHIVGPLLYKCETLDDGTTRALVRVLAWDIDNHNPDNVSAPPIANWRFAQAIYTRMKHWSKCPGFTPLLTDSNGAGGFHIRVFFDTPVIMCLARALGVFIASDYAKYSVQGPEVFPKQSHPSGLNCGSWIRLPGKHHTRDHWSRVWDGDSWLDGIDAVSYILGSNPDRFTTGFTLPVAAERFVVPSPGTRRDGTTSKIVQGTPACILQDYPSGRVVEKPGDMVFTVELLRDALSHYTCENLQNPEIYRVGGALKQLGDEVGLELWLVWLTAHSSPYWKDRSPNASSYTEEYWLQTWTSFDPERGHPGYIFNRAKELGWDKDTRARIIRTRLRARAMLARVRGGPGEPI